MDTSANRRFGSPGVVGGIVGYVLQGMRPGRNPLRRASDRVEATAWLAATLLFLFVAPLCALYPGIQAYAAGVRTERAQTTDRHPATAVLLENAPDTPAVPQEGPGVSQPTRARWVAPHGTPNQGRVDAPPGTEAGHRIQIWLDRAGRPTVPPQTHRHTVTNGIATGLGVLLAAFVVLLLVPLAIRLGLDRRRLARWDAEWKLVEPRWTGRRRPEEQL